VGALVCGALLACRLGNFRITRGGSLFGGRPRFLTGRHADMAGRRRIAQEIAQYTVQRCLLRRARDWLVNALDSLAAGLPDGLASLIPWTRWLKAWLLNALDSLA
jgi:hypothetical protein